MRIAFDARSLIGPRTGVGVWLEGLLRGLLAAEWGVSENNRKAKFYRLTRAGRKQLAKETRDWEQATAILARFFSPEEDAS